MAIIINNSKKSPAFAKYLEDEIFIGSLTSLAVTTLYGGKAGALCSFIHKEMVGQREGRACWVPSARAQQVTGLSSPSRL